MKFIFRNDGRHPQTRPRHMKIKFRAHGGLLVTVPDILARQSKFLMDLYHLWGLYPDWDGILDLEDYPVQFLIDYIRGDTIIKALDAYLELGTNNASSDDIEI